jgi:cell division protein ZapA (FtsZ GTPase activity inhibitor)
MSRKSIAVRIAGHEYKLLSDGDDETMQQIASYVDRAMKRVRERTGTVDTLDVSVLTCLNLAREILTLRDAKDDADDADNATNDERIRALIERVETAMGGETSSSSAEVEASGANEKADSEKVGQTRTLDLPSVESMRERAAASSTAGSPDATSNQDSMPEARVASGGRDRAS